MLRSPEKPTIVFDIDGLVNFPRFNQEVVLPLQARRDLCVGFWSLTGRTTGRIDSRLLRVGIENADFSLGGDLMSDLSWANNSYENLPYTRRDFPIKDNDPLMEREINGDYKNAELIRTSIRSTMGDYGRRLGMSRITNQYLDKMEIRARTWLALAREIDLEREWPWSLSETGTLVLLKYPPLLSNQSTILIESDCVSINHSAEPNERIRADRVNEVQAKFAKIGNFSLVHTPEYYDAENFGDYQFNKSAWGPGAPIDQADFLLYLRDMLLNWNGDHMVSNLGENLGIYPYFRSK